MSGLFAGLQLRARGFAVDIYERVDSELSGRGAGIVAQPVVPRTMRALGIDTADLGVEMTTRKILDAEGRVVVEAHCPQTLTAWERLYRILRDAFPAAHYHRGIGLKGFEQSGRSVTARFTDGRSVEADLLVGADGIRSTVRQQLLPNLNAAGRTVPRLSGGGSGQ
jgi:2-polyprenyl-6-methoxyphenol hydroxylase-like FAD-dependent oxidoreductase